MKENEKYGKVKFKTVFEMVLLSLLIIFSFVMMVFAFVSVMSKAQEVSDVGGFCLKSDEKFYLNSFANKDWSVRNNVASLNVRGSSPVIVKDDGDTKLLSKTFLFEDDKWKVQVCNNQVKDSKFKTIPIYDYSSKSDLLKTKIKDLDLENFSSCEIIELKNITKIGDKSTIIEIQNNSIFWSISPEQSVCDYKDCFSFIDVNNSGSFNVSFLSSDLDYGFVKIINVSDYYEECLSINDSEEPLPHYNCTRVLNGSHLETVDNSELIESSELLLLDVPYVINVTDYYINCSLDLTNCTTSIIGSHEETRYKSISSKDNVSITLQPNETAKFKLKAVLKEPNSKVDYSMILSMFGQDWLIDPSFISTSTNFANGTYSNTFLNTSGFVQLNATYWNGSYSSQIFDAGEPARWDNISWFEEVNYQTELPNNGTTETGDFVRKINMTKNSLLLHLNNDSNYGENNTNAYDFSGNENNGTIFESIFNNTGKFNGAYQFDGIDDFINITNKNNFDFISGYFTISQWVKFSPSETQAVLISKMGTGTNLQYRVWFNVDNFFAELIHTSGNIIIRKQSSDSIITNKWYNLITVFKVGDPEDVDIYVNGIKDNFAVNSNGTSLYNTAATNAQLWIGDEENGGVSNLNGTIDEVAIWNRSLTDTEILDIYKRGALRLNISAKTCDDNICSGESLTDLSDSSYQNLSSLGSNQYFQYIFNFTTDNLTYSPYLYNVTVNYSDVLAPRIAFVNQTPVNGFNTDENSILVNVSINESRLSSFNWTWNGTTYPQYNDSLKLMFNFDNVSAIGENATKVVDVSNYSNNGTINGAVWNNTGKYGSALQFDGVNDYVNSTNSASLNPADITIGFWMKANNQSTNQRIILNEGGKYGISILPNGSLELSQWVTDAIDVNVGSFINSWHYVVGNIPVGGTNSKIYFDGNLVKTGTLTTRSGSTNDYLLIGTRSALSQFFNGSIDEVRIWNRSLSASEIQQMYYSNLNKYNTNNWYFIVNESNLSVGNYTYQACVNDTSNNQNCTETRLFNVGISSINISFNEQTPINDTNTTETSMVANVSINTTLSNLSSFNWTWNGTTYNLYNQSLIRLYNFNNLSSLGEGNCTLPAKAVMDLSIYEKNLSCTGSPIFTSNGKYGGAFIFNKDFIFTENSNGIGTGGNVTFTISAWIKINDTVGDQTIYSQALALGTRTCINMRMTNGSLSLDFCNVGKNATIPIPVQEWHHVAVTKDFGTINASSKLYVDGSEVNYSFYGTDGYTNIFPTASKIGYDNAVGNRFNGTLDELAIWNRSLTASEIKQVYYSNLNKYASNNWYFYTNQTNLSLGNYTYKVCANDSVNNQNCTEQRLFNIVEYVPIVSINKTSNVSIVYGADLFNYTITINVSNNTAYNLSVNDTYPSQFAYVTSQPSPTIGNNFFFLGNLSNETIFVINITFNATHSTSNNTLINNSANITYQSSYGTYYSIKNNMSILFLQSYPNITFENQNPSDITTDFFGTDFNFTYNVNHFGNIPINYSNTSFWFKTNNSDANYCSEFINKTCLHYGNVYKLDTNNYTYNSSNGTVKFVADDNEIYSGTFNWNIVEMENLQKQIFNLSNPTEYLKIRIYNFSNHTNVSILEVYAQNSTGDLGALRFYYCNESYSSGNPTINSNCVFVTQLLPNLPFNHTHTENSSHYVLPFIINTTSGSLNGIHITSNSTILARGVTGSVWKIYYIPYAFENNAFRRTTNNGNSWSTVVGTPDIHLHQFSGNETFCSFADSYNNLGYYSNSSERCDYLSYGNLPPSSPVVYSPNLSTFNYGQIWINYTQSISTNGYVVNYTNISLFTVNRTYVETIVKTNGQNLTYLWNSTNVSDGYYIIRVYACDSNNLCSVGSSENFSINNTNNASATKIANINYINASTTYTLNYTVSIDVHNGTLVNVTMHENFPTGIWLNNSLPINTSSNTWSLGNLSLGIFAINISANISSSLVHGEVKNNSVNITYGDYLGFNHTLYASVLTHFLDVEPPNVTADSPENNYQFNETGPTNVTFNCSAVDNGNLSSISIWITDNQTAHFAFNQTKLVTGTSNTTNFSINLSYGNYTWACFANDTIGNTNYSSNKTVFMNFTYYGLNISSNSYLNYAPINNITNYTITVFNTGNSEETFNLSVNNLSGVNVAVLNQSNITILANSSLNITLNVSSNITGEFNVTIFGYLSTNLSINYTSSNITSVFENVSSISIILLTPIDDAIGGLLIGYFNVSLPMLGIFEIATNCTLVVDNSTASSLLEITSNGTYYFISNMLTSKKLIWNVNCTAPLATGSSGNRNYYQAILFDEMLTEENTMNITAVMSLIAFLISLGIIGLKIVNIGKETELYSTAWSLISTAGYLICWLILLNGLLTYPETMIYRTLFVISSILLGINILLTIIEIAFKMNFNFKRNMRTP